MTNISLFSKRTLGLNSIFCLVLSLCFTGCAGLHPYNSAKHKTMSDTEKAYNEVKLVEVIDTERNNLDTILDQQLDVVRKYNIALRDLKVFSIIDDNRFIKDSLFKEAEDNILALCFPDIAKSSAFISSTEELELDVKLAQNQYYTASGKMPPSFYTPEKEFPENPPEDHLKGCDDNKKEKIKATYTKYRNDAIGAMDLIKTSIGTTTGTVQEAYKEWQEELIKLNESKKQAKDKKAAYQKAVEEYEKAKKAGTELTYEQQVRKAIDGVGKKLEELSESDIYGKAEAALIKLQTIDTLIQHSVTGETEKTSSENKKAESEAKTATSEKNNDKEMPKKSLSEALAVARTIRPLADQIGDIVQKANQPILSSLIIEKDLQKERLAYANRKINRREQRVDLLFEKFKTTILELKYNVEITQSQNDINAIYPTYLDSTVQSILTSKEPLAKRFVYSALFSYAKVYGIARTKRDEIEYRLIDLDYKESLDASETAVKLWNSLIATPINRLAIYHGSGIKSTEVADLLVKALGLGAIAWRAD